MNKQKENTLKKVESYLKKYKDDKSIYYEELKKSYKEYKNLDINDINNELYIKHLNELCDFIKSKKNASKIIFMLVTSSIFIIILCIFTSVKYYQLSHDLESNVLFRNGKTSLSVNYSNVENFDANTLSDDGNFKNLEPLTVTLLANNKEKKTRMFHYDIYLVEQNEDIDSSNKLSKDAFLYNVSSSTKESGIKGLKNATIKKDKMLIFSGEMPTNKEENIDLRMWIDSNTDIDYTNKKYKFKLMVEGYII